MTSMWNDFNDARQNANLIPKGTLAKVRLTIRPGGFWRKPLPSSG